jgi:hypothetical protein
MVPAFFDSKGLIYTNYMPRGNTVILWIPWASPWRFSSRKGLRWWLGTGGSTGTMLWYIAPDTPGSLFLDVIGKIVENNVQIFSEDYLVRSVKKTVSL